MASPDLSRIEGVERLLFDLIPRLTPSSSPMGRPEVLPGAMLWSGVLVCILRKLTSQSALWRLLSQHGLWSFPRTPVCAEAVRIRLVRSGPETMRQLCLGITGLLHDQSPGDLTLAPFAMGVYALDATTLDQVSRRLPTLRDVPDGDRRRLPGKLHVAFDVRRQQFATILPTDLPYQNEKVAARDLLATLPAESLVLADQGYFSFPWFDDLTEAKYWYVSKCRAKTSFLCCHTLTRTTHVTDELVWLGAYRADRAKHLVRRIEVRFGGFTWCYLTNVLDPTQLSVAEVMRLYGRRWDIERLFSLIKKELGLHLLWSSQWELILTQVWGVILIAQIATSLRWQIAERAGVDLFVVSLNLLVRDLPYLVHDHGDHLVDHLASLPVVKGGYLRPSTRKQYDVPIDLPITPAPPDLPLTRTPRYAGRRCNPGRI